MFKVVLKTSLRNIIRNGGNSIVNLVSLTIGLSISVVIYTIISYQYSFDHHHKNADRVYRVNFTEHQEWGTKYGSQTPEPLHKVLRSDYPQIEAVSRTVGPMETNVFIGDDKFAQPYILFIDEYFTQLFDQEWVAGTPDVFKDPKAVVLTETTAKKLFGDTNPIGKTINFRRRVDGVVRGLVKDPKMNTNLPYYMLAHLDMMKEIEEFYVRDSWESMSIGTTWVLLPGNVQPSSLAVQMTDIIESNLGADAAEVFGFELGPLKKIHTDDRFAEGVNYTVPSETIYGLLIIGFIVLLTCCINFVNLSTAHALKRAREVGIKKILGGSRKHLAHQFFLELGMITLVAAFFALWFAEIMLHQVNVLLSMISLDLSLSWSSIGFTVLLVVIITLAAGLYPVAILTGFNSIDAIKTKFTQRKGSKAIVRNSLLGIQFIFCQVLVIMVLVFNSQFRFIQNADLGYDTENIMMFRNFLPNIWSPSAAAISSAKSQLLENPNIEHVSFGTGGPNAQFAWNTAVVDPSDPTQREIDCDYKLVDIAYRDLFNLDMVAGTWFTPTHYKDDVQRVIITELMVEKLGWEDAETSIGKRLTTNGRPSIVVGVLADFHSDNLRSAIKPSVFESNNSGWSQGFIKYKKGGFKATASHFEQVSKTINSYYIPDYIDFTDELALDYEIDKLVFRFINFTTILSIIIGCLGLYSLISFIAQQRTKEIGIRKVIGANVNSLMVMLSSKYILLMLVTAIIASPMGYWLASIWLEGFAFRTGIGPMIFIITFLGTAFLAMLSISHRAYKAATTNPVKSLRYE